MHLCTHVPAVCTYRTHLRPCQRLLYSIRFGSAVDRVPTNILSKLPATLVYAIHTILSLTQVPRILPFFLSSHWVAAAFPGTTRALSASFFLFVFYPQTQKSNLMPSHPAPLPTCRPVTPPSPACSSTGQPHFPVLFRRADAVRPLLIHSPSIVLTQ